MSGLVSQLTAAPKRPIRRAPALVPVRLRTRDIKTPQAYPFNLNSNHRNLIEAMLVYMSPQQGEAPADARPPCRGGSCRPSCRYAVASGCPARRSVACARSHPPAHPPVPTGRGASRSSGRCTAYLLRSTSIGVGIAKCGTVLVNPGLLIVRIMLWSGLSHDSSV
eukprot:COSAG01_NODE_5571_length_4175_cov_5.300540_2_plen_165_part_00